MTAVTFSLTMLSLPWKNMEEESSICKNKCYSNRRSFSYKNVFYRSV